jgi:hypothetical protein
MSASSRCSHVGVGIMGQPFAGRMSKSLTRVTRERALFFRPWIGGREAAETTVPVTDVHQRPNLNTCSE